MHSEYILKKTKGGRSNNIPLLHHKQRSKNGKIMQQQNNLPAWLILICCSSVI